MNAVSGPARLLLLLLPALALLARVGRTQAIYNPPAGRDLAGVWLIEGDHSAVRTIEGRLPPMNRSAARRYAAAVQSRKAGRPDFDTIRSCRPHGLPRILFAAYPLEILQEPRQLTFIHEVQHMPRLVYLDMTLPPLSDMDPNWMGLSVGHWDTDTLVIESQGFNDLTTLDAAGLPHSTALQVRERLRKLDPDTLEDLVTVTDPQTFSSAWSTRVTYRRQPGLRLKEYVCTDSNPEAAAH